jgi:hypothetical protein
MNDKITVRISSEVRQAIERLRYENPTRLISTQAACRHIMEDWLVRNSYLCGPAAALADAPSTVSTTQMSIEQPQASAALPVVRLGRR